ncbi:MAG: hypothetical protein Q9171_001797 [Xanthocarpia ochracea]
MLDHILPLMIKVGRQVPGSGPTTHVAASEDQQANNAMWEDFEDSGLDWAQDREFRRTYLPNTFNGIGYGSQIAHSLAKETGVKKPKADRAYGLTLNFIPPPEDLDGVLRPETEELFNAIPGLHHVFFLIEGVRSVGDPDKAVNQACRGGTVAVRTQRLILQTIGHDTMSEGADSQTYVYTEH